MPQHTGTKGKFNPRSLRTAASLVALAGPGAHATYTHGGPSSSNTTSLMSHGGPATRSKHYQTPTGTPTRVMTQYPTIQTPSAGVPSSALPASVVQQLGQGPGDQPYFPGDTSTLSPMQLGPRKGGGGGGGGGGRGGGGARGGSGVAPGYAGGGSNVAATLSNPIGRVLRFIGFQRR